MTKEISADNQTELAHEVGVGNMTPGERRATFGLVLVYVTRMLGLFMVLPVLSSYGLALEGATPALLGLALGIYGLMQAMLQIPFGMASDRFGRKPLIVLGLAVFIMGSVVAANADSVATLILGRALQGGGAVAAAVLALAADLSREEQRTKVMAILGASIGMAFVLSLVLGPFVAGHWGLSGVFWLAAMLGVLAVLAVLSVVPSAPATRRHRDAQSHRDQLSEVLKNVALLRLDGGIFLLHATMTACFVVLPLSLVDAGAAADDHWKTYLPAVGIALLVLLPMMGIASGKAKGRLVFLVSIAALAVVQLGFSLAATPLQLLLAIGLFFGFFSVLESMLPSLVSKLAPAGSKGTAMGVYSSGQFMGAFVGGSAGGLLFQAYGAQAVFLITALCCLLWLLFAWGMVMPARTAVVLIRSHSGAREGVKLEQQLSAAPGVLDVFYDTDAEVFHLKLDKDTADADALRALCARKVG